MLQQTFIHIPGIGKQTELELWEHGIRTWDDADRFEKRFGAVGARLQKKLDEYIPLSRDAIKRKDASFFERLSDFGEAWRLFPDFADNCVYLDIETTGLSPVFDIITVVGLYDGRRYRAFVQGDNLQDLPAYLGGYSLAVTFNGAGFDLRFLRLAFEDLALPAIHIDLRWLTRKLGMRGGLKSVEAQMGLKRDDSVQDISGYDATVLWARYLRRDKSALDQLIQYNTEDVVHLKAIMEMAYDKLVEGRLDLLGNWGARAFTSVAKEPPSNRRALLRRAPKQRYSRDLVQDLLKKCRRAPKVVGIDLTGSEKRATGWALMDGASVTTKPIITDDELISETVAAKPDLVSIDSPLSLPERYGEAGAPIYRKCELALKRMGISVFWCLLPSMEMLTRRGIGLAQALREAGCKVIESYPGAAQDILGIPRKKASLEELKWGLSRAGINGDFQTAKITHDEVDAITSALVGLFYLADEHMALGTITEDFLIVPRSTKFNYQKLAQIIAATGLDEVPTVERSKLGSWPEV
ncbi:MAG TPA: ribonuclease H-like domain-containing protein [Terriglobia bacterium]|nr:ribonuclease H-like domain-containing protein [Terriglobia bacterium]